MHQDEIDELQEHTHREVDRNFVLRSLRFFFIEKKQPDTAQGEQEIRGIAVARIARFDREDHGCNPRARGFNRQYQCESPELCSLRRAGVECLVGCRNCRNRPVCRRQVLPPLWKLIAQQGIFRIAYPFDIRPHTWLIEVTGIVRRLLRDANGNPIMDYDPDLVFFIDHTPFIMDISSRSNLSRYIKPGCNPNAKLVTLNTEDDMRLFITSYRFIPAGETVQFPRESISDKCSDVKNPCVKDHCLLPRPKIEPKYELYDIGPFPEGHIHERDIHEKAAVLTQAEQAEADLRAATLAKKQKEADEWERKVEEKQKILEGYVLRNFSIDEAIEYRQTKCAEYDEQIEILRQAELIRCRLADQARGNNQQAHPSPLRQPLLPSNDFGGTSTDGTVEPLLPIPPPTATDSDQVIPKPKKKNKKDKKDKDDKKCKKGKSGKEEKNKKKPTVDLTKPPHIRPSKLGEILLSNNAQNLGRENDLGFAAQESTEPAPKKKAPPKKKPPPSANNEGIHISLEYGGKRITRAQVKAALEHAEASKNQAAVDDQQPCSSAQAKARQEKEDEMRRKLRVQPKKGTEEEKGEEQPLPKKKKSPRKPGRKSKRKDEDEEDSSSPDEAPKEPFQMILVPKSKSYPKLNPGQPIPEGFGPRQYIRKWFCKYRDCGEIIYNKSNMIEHANKHNKSREYICGGFDGKPCGADFPSQKNLNRHIKEVHMKKDEVHCKNYESCGYSTDVPSRLKRHEGHCTGKKYKRRKKVYENAGAYAESVQDEEVEEEEDVDGVAHGSSSEEDENDGQ